MCATHEAERDTAIQFDSIQFTSQITTTKKMAETSDQEQGDGSSSAVDEVASATSPQQEEEVGIEQLSITVDPPPLPIKMSRGDTSSMESLGDACGNTGTGCSNSGIPPTLHPLAPSTEEEGAVSSAITSITTASENNGDKIILTANHHGKLSQGNLNLDSDGGGGRTVQHQTSNNSYQSSRRSSKDSQNNQCSATSAAATSSSTDDNKGGAAAPIPKVLLAPITGAWGWIQKQNQKQKQKHLNQLAEEQVEILKQAQKNDPNIDFAVMEENCNTNNSNSNNDAYATPPNSQCKLEAEAEAAVAHESSRIENEEDDDISWIPAVRIAEERIKRDFMPSPRSSRTGNNNNSASPNNSTTTDPTKPVPMILSQEQMNDIARHVLPKGIAFCRWNRLYSLTRDGDSFFQCLRLCGNEPKTLVVIKTTRGAILGGYADAPWELRSAHSHGAFHGSASAALFSFSIDNNDKDDNNKNASGKGSKASKTNPKCSTNLKVFHWTGANRYIQYTDSTDGRRMLAFGGGGQEGAFGLSVEQDFQFGSTGPCDTFGNLPLCDQENFNIMDMEIWSFLTGQF